MDCTPKTKPRKPILSDADRQRVNCDLLGAAWEQREDVSPPRLPRLKRPPAARPLLEPEPKRLSPNAYKPETIGAFALAREEAA